MAELKKSGRHSPLSFVMAFSLAAVAIPSVTGAQAQVAALEPSSATKPAEVRIVSTEFNFAPAKVRVAAGRAVTLVLDNSGAETEHDLFFPALGLRLQAKAGEITWKSTAFEKPGEYEFLCDLPGHRDAGMKGTLIVGAFSPAVKLRSISRGGHKIPRGGHSAGALSKEAKRCQKTAC
jgi:uncharacterized cupredoxin-like copper-binding protein